METRRRPRVKYPYGALIFDKRLQGIVPVRATLCPAIPPHRQQHPKGVVGHHAQGFVAVAPSVAVDR